MSIPKLFTDGLTSLTSKLANRRNAHATNRMTTSRVDWDELRAIYKTGVGSKIIRTKSGMALNGTLQFESEGDKDFSKHDCSNTSKTDVNSCWLSGGG